MLKLIIAQTLQVIALDISLPVKQAFHILYEQVDVFYAEGKGGGRRERNYRVVFCSSLLF